MRLSLSLRGPRLKRLKETRGESGSHPHLPLSCLAQTHRRSDRLVSEKTALMTDAAGARGQPCLTEVALSSTDRTQTPHTSMTIFFFFFFTMYVLNECGSKGHLESDEGERTPGGFQSIRILPIVCCSNTAVIRQ